MPKNKNDKSEQEINNNIEVAEAEQMKKESKILEQDFTAGAIHSLSTHRGSTGDKELDKGITDVVKSWDVSKDKRELIEELLVTAYKINRSNLQIADLKLINRSLKEMRVANKVFTKYVNERKIAIYGSARTKPEEPSYKAAEKFAKKIRKKGFMVITGAGDGIMGAAQKGAGRKHGFGLNISLPFEQDANETIRGDKKLIEFNYFFTRKLSFVKECHAVALFPGGIGTMDECFEMLTLVQTGKSAIAPIVMVDRPGGVYWQNWFKFIKNDLLRLKLISPEDLHLFLVTDDIDEAVEEIVNFYKVFHSYRFVKNKLVIRLNSKISDEKLDIINAKYSSLLKSGKFYLQKSLKEEYNEPEIKHLWRLIGNITQDNFGLIRLLIDEINRD